jgi:hydrogenase 3 maturation protease
VRWLDWRDTTGLSASTHTLPPYLLGRYLSAELGCQVGVLGVQPASLAFDAPVSDAVLRAVGEIAAGLAGILAGGPRDEGESEDG